MITEETVFILGAGASRPYEYPVGSELRKKICIKLKADFLDNEIDSNEVYITQFMDAYAHSNVYSIDKFLTNNPNFEYIGKKAVVYYILESEVKSNFPYQLKSSKLDWFSELYNIMTNEMLGADSYNQFLNNKVSFIIFNYDRMLEAFLFDSLRNNYKHIPFNKISEIIKKISVIHVYGKIVNLPWEGSTESAQYKKVDYQNHEVLDNYIENIRVIYDERNEDTIIEKAKSILEKAERIFFLGFGYAKENLQLLGMPSILNRDHRIFGSALGLSQNEIDKISSIFKTIDNKSFHHIHIEDCDSKMLLRNYL
jgi:hypothetical protein